MQYSIDTTITQVSRVALTPALFREAVTIFNRAASGVDPADHIGGPVPKQPGIRLTNIPMNRGMLAVMRFSRQHGPETQQALALRIMYFMPAVQQAANDPRFAHVVKVRDDSDFEYEATFRDAYAQCRFSLVDGDEMGPDMDDIHRILVGGGLS